MKTLFIGFVLLSILCFVFQACALVSSKGTELQAYQVLKHEKEFEVRYYPETTVATITSSATTYKDLGNPGFRKLAGYIFGGNEQKQQIAMTAPVHMEISDSVSAMSFVMPSQYNKEGLPRPDNAEVSIQTAPAEQVAVIRFGGFASDRKIRRYTEKLRTSMLGIFCWRQKRGLFLSIFAFLKEHSKCYVTEKRGKVAKKGAFWAQLENSQHARKLWTHIRFSIPAISATWGIIRRSSCLEERTRSLCGWIGRR